MASVKGSSQRWTAVFNLPGRAGLSWSYRLLIAAFFYPAGIALGFGIIGLWSWSYSVRDREPGKYTGERMVVAFIAVILVAHRVAKRVVARRARELITQDPRPPVLLLRAFSDDQNKLGETEGAIGPWRRTITLEEILTGQLTQLGPTIAVGRPGELLPPPGAARLWLDNNAWQNGIHILLEECQYIVMVMGRIRGNDGLAWELEQIKHLGLLSKLILIVPAVSEREAEQRWNAYGALLDAQLPPYLPFTCFARRSPSGQWIIVCSSGEGREVRDYQEKIKVES
jgi:hypothetical protein